MGEYRVTFNGETQTFRFNEPVKFEVGQVVRVKLPERRHATVVLITCVDIGRELVHGLDHASGSRAIVLFMDASLYATELLSPAPRIGDKWTNGESVARIDADGATNLRIVSKGEPFVGDVVAVARRLWEGGYRVARARTAAESSADVLASMARAGVKKWSDRGTLGVSNAADVRERFAAFMPRDPDLPGASGAPAYLTLDYLKALVPTHAEATARRMPTFGEMLASDPYAQALVDQVARDADSLQSDIDATVRHVVANFGCSVEDATVAIRCACEAVTAPWTQALSMIRSGDSMPFAMVRERLLALKKKRSDREDQERAANFGCTLAEIEQLKRDAPPRHGDVYKNATQTIRVLVCADGDLRTQIVESSLPEMQREIARHPADAMAEYLRERGYVRVETDDRSRRWSKMLKNGVDARAFVDRVDCVRDVLARRVERGDSVGDAARNIQRAIDSTRADRATVDDLRKLADVYDAPELRAGMVVCESMLRNVRFGCVSNIGPTLCIRWSGDRGSAEYSADTVAIMFRRRAWRIVDPDIRPLAALADAVASIFATPDLATSRRYIDMAIASVRGEPFAHAIRAVLVAASDAPLSAHTLAGIVRGARSHERRRSDVAPGRRELTVDQLSMCAAAAFYDADGCWNEQLSRVYERARAAG